MPHSRAVGERIFKSKLIVSAAFSSYQIDWISLSPCAKFSGAVIPEMVSGYGNEITLMLKPSQMVLG